MLMHDNPNESFRMERLAKVADSVADIEGLVGLHDHEGFLTCTWREPPSRRDLFRIAMVWEFVGHENRPHVEHTRLGKEAA